MTADEATRVALVTGANGGIGRAIAALFGAEGWRTVGTDRLEPASPHVDRFVCADLADPDAIEALVASVAQREGRLDALVNNAALQVVKPFEALTIEDWDRVMAVNLRAPFWLLRNALPLLEASRGAVVNVSSVHAVATSEEITAYATSKGGLAAFTRACALDVAGRGVRVNAVLPGAVDTPMLRDGFARGHLADGDVETQLASFGERHPLGRVGRPVEIAQAVLYLADGDRSSYVTGACHVVDGGVTARLSTE